MRGVPTSCYGVEGAMCPGSRAPPSPDEPLVQPGGSLAGSVLTLFAWIRWKFFPWTRKPCSKFLHSSSLHAQSPSATRRGQWCQQCSDEGSRQRVGQVWHMLTSDHLHVEPQPP